MRWPVRWLKVWCMPVMYASTDTFRWSPSVRIYASQIAAVPPQLPRRCFQWRGRCRSSTSTKPLLTICPMSRATSSTRSVMITRSLCPRLSWACCASCTLMVLSSLKIEPLGREHSNVTSWSDNTFRPNSQRTPRKLSFWDLCRANGEELGTYIEHYSHYKVEAVHATLAELRTRGVYVSEATVAEIARYFTRHE